MDFRANSEGVFITEAIFTFLIFTRMNGILEAKAFSILLRFLHLLLIHIGEFNFSTKAITNSQTLCCFAHSSILIERQHQLQLWS